MMNAFWNSIALKIVASFKNGEPSGWKKREIDFFLGELVGKVREICKNSPSKRNLLVDTNTLLKTDKACDNIDLSYDTFRRIFITKEGHGGKSTREMFSIYFGYESFKDYVSKNNLKTNIKDKLSETSNKKSKPIDSEVIEDENTNLKKIDLKNITAEEEVSVKIKQTDKSSAKINDLEAKKGSINIDIEQG